VQAKRDTESSIFIIFLIPAFAGMTMLTAFDDCDTVSAGDTKGALRILLPFVVSF
jgi:hypothetical protein